MRPLRKSIVRETTLLAVASNTPSMTTRRVEAGGD